VPGIQGNFAHCALYQNHMYRPGPGVPDWTGRIGNRLGQYCAAGVPWKETYPMREKRLFIEAVLAKHYSMSELCRQFGISRKTGYKWWRRFQEAGLPGLAELDRVAYRHPHATSEQVVKLVISARRAHPIMGYRFQVAVASARCRCGGLSWAFGRSELRGASQPKTVVTNGCTER
jgi:transposase-like protein